jgi:hypothetical protein
MKQKVHCINCSTDKSINNINNTIMGYICNECVEHMEFYFPILKLERENSNG